MDACGGAFLRGLRPRPARALLITRSAPERRATALALEDGAWYGLALHVDRRPLRRLARLPTRGTRVQVARCSARAPRSAPGRRARLLVRRDQPRHLVSDGIRSGGVRLVSSRPSAVDRWRPMCRTCCRLSCGSSTPIGRAAAWVDSAGADRHRWPGAVGRVLRSPIRVPDGWQRPWCLHERGNPNRPAGHPHGHRPDRGVHPRGVSGSLFPGARRPHLLQQPVYGIFPARSRRRYGRRSIPASLPRLDCHRLRSRWPDGRPIHHRFVGGAGRDGRLLRRDVARGSTRGRCWSTSTFHPRRAGVVQPVSERRDPHAGLPVRRTARVQSSKCGRRPLLCPGRGRAGNPGLPGPHHGHLCDRGIAGRIRARCPRWTPTPGCVRDTTGRRHCSLGRIHTARR